MKITLLTGRMSDFGTQWGFELKVVRSAAAKRLTLRIDEKAHGAVLTVPRWCSAVKAQKFVAEQRDWVINMLAKLPPVCSFDAGTEFCFFGQKYRVEHSVKQRGAVLVDGRLKIGGDAEFLHRRVMDFLKEQSLKILAELTLNKAKQLDCRVAAVAIKDTKSRWGSCSTRGQINYNWRIAMAPMEVIDYLVSHEVAHLRHPNHSEEFWQTVRELCPQYKENRHWLKVRGKELYRFI